MLWMEEQGSKKSDRCQHKELSKNMMILHTVVFSSESFLFKSESIDKATGHRFALGDLKGPLQFRFYLRRLQIQKENLSGLNTLISLEKKNEWSWEQRRGGKVLETSW